MEHKFAKYLKEGCRFSSNGELFFKYFLNIAVASDLDSVGGVRRFVRFPTLLTTGFSLFNQNMAEKVMIIEILCS